MIDYPLLIPGLGSQDFFNTIAGLNPVLWYRFREASGTTTQDYSGNGFTGTIANTVTLGQTGQLGASEAFDFIHNPNPGGRVFTANNIAFANLTTFTFAHLVNPDSAGQLNFGIFSCYGDANSTSENHIVFNGALTSITARLYNTTPTEFRADTTTGLNTGAWKWVFWQYDNSGDRRSHIFVNATELAYSLQQAMTGTFKAPNNPLNVANTTGGSLGFDGKMDEFMIFSYILSASQLQSIVDFSGL